VEIRICPNCRKHNSANSWHCDNCGQTLSINTLTEVDATLVNLDEIPHSVPKTSQSSRNASAEELEDDPKSKNESVEDLKGDPSLFKRYPNLTAIVVSFLLSFGLRFLSLMYNPSFYLWQIIVQAVIEGVLVAISISTVIIITRIFRPSK